METTRQIKNAFERNVRALSLRPSVGIGTAVTRVRLTEGLSCEITDGPWRLTADMGEKHGGSDAGPNPGVLGRGALGACLAMGYVQWASRENIELTSLEVAVEADYDASGIYGVSDQPARYREVRCIVTVESNAAREDVLRILDEADAHSPYFDLFRHGVELYRKTRFGEHEES